MPNYKCNRSISRCVRARAHRRRRTLRRTMSRLHCVSGSLTRSFLVLVPKASIPKRAESEKRMLPANRASITFASEDEETFSLSLSLSFSLHASICSSVGARGCEHCATMPHGVWNPRKCQRFIARSMRMNIDRLLLSYRDAFPAIN